MKRGKPIFGKWSMAVLIAAWLGLIWIHTMTDGIREPIDWIWQLSDLVTSGLTMLVTILIGFNLFLWDEELGIFYEEDDDAEPDDKDDDDDHQHSHSVVGVQMVIPCTESVHDAGADSEHSCKVVSIPCVDAQDSVPVAGTEAEDPAVRPGNRTNGAAGTVAAPAIRVVRKAMKSLYGSMVLMMAMMLLCLFSVAAMTFLGAPDLFGDSSIVDLGICVISKKPLYAPLVMVLFPLWSTWMIRKMGETSCHRTAVHNVILQILLLTMMGFLFYMMLSNIWLAEMAILNVVTVSLAVKRYAWEHIERKGNAVALIILYTLFWLVLLFVGSGSGSLYSLAAYWGLEHQFDPADVSSYVTNVRKLWQGAAMIGQSSTLSLDADVRQFIDTRDYPIMTLLYDCGWVPAVIYFMIILIWVLALRDIRIKRAHHDGRDVMLDIVWLNLAIRVVSSLLYSLGLPIPFSQPFTSGIKEDSLCMGLLIIAYEVDRHRSLYEINWDEDDWDEEDEDNEGGDNESAGNVDADDAQIDDKNAVADESADNARPIERSGTSVRIGQTLQFLKENKLLGWILVLIAAIVFFLLWIGSLTWCRSVILEMIRVI